MTLAIVTATCGAECLDDAVNSWRCTNSDGPYTYVINGEKGMMQAYQEGLRESREDILAYQHDDVLFTEPAQDIWDRVMHEFEDESVGVVGFCGALALGDPDLYKKPYVLQQLARRGVLSNMEDAEVHGARFTGECDVATLDGFCLITRRAILERAGGWPVDTPIGYINYDHWLCLTARRYGYRVRLVGAKVLHMGGQTMVKLKPELNTPEAHAAAHVALYNDFADVLPIEVKP